MNKLLKLISITFILTTLVVISPLGEGKDLPPTEHYSR